MKTRHVIDIEKQIETNPYWPTNYHEPEFWEALGRAIATISLLEETLKKSIYVITGARKVSNEDRENEEFKAWLKGLETTISNPLSSLIKRYEEAVRKNEKFLTTDFESLLKELQGLKEWRNILCHGSWRPPNDDGKSCPIFVKKNGDIFRGEIDLDLLRNIRVESAKMICILMNNITSNGFQFPGAE